MWQFATGETESVFRLPGLDANEAGRMTERTTRDRKYPFDMLYTARGVAKQIKKQTTLEHKVAWNSTLKMGNELVDSITEGRFTPIAGISTPPPIFGQPVKIMEQPARIWRVRRGDQSFRQPTLGLRFAQARESKELGAHVWVPIDEESGQAFV